MENNTPDNDDQGSIKPIKPLFLLLLDGWGIAGSSEANPISSAKKPYLDKIMAEYPATSLQSGPGDLNQRYQDFGANGVLTSAASAAGIKQLKIFTGERLAALTYFFNGRREEKAAGEDWLSISSENSQHQLDYFLGLKRTMAAALKALKEGGYSLIIVSCPIMDSLATAGEKERIAKALTAIDRGVKKLAQEIASKDGLMVISAVHGNAEHMMNLGTEFPDKEMTDNPVPFMIFSPTLAGKTLGFPDAPENDLSLLAPSGKIIDAAPTIAKLMNLPLTEDPAGQPLIAEE